jgi:uncharacterized protein (TIGR03382 family)
VTAAPVRPHPSRWLGPTTLVAATLATTPGHAAEPTTERPATWDMTREELRAIGLGQSRGDPVRPTSPPLGTPPRPAAGGQPPPAIIFVNFDGATLTQGGDHAPMDSSEIFGGEFAPYGVGDKRAAVMQATRADWVAYNIDVVDVRPASGDYTMNMTGPTNFVGAGVLGIAPLDCWNQGNPNNVTYAFHSVDDGFDAATTATTIGQEVAHSYGLEHVDEPGDILNPFNAGGNPSFIDECLPLSDGGFASFCASQHAEFCPDGTGQNSHQELLRIFGPKIPDVDGPVVLITAPLNGTLFDAGASFNVLVTINDESQVAKAELYSNGQLADVDTSPPWGWQVNNVPAGLYAIEVLATDEHGNQGLSSPISILVGGGVAGDSEGDEGDPDAGSADGSGSDGGETEGAGQDDDAKGCGCAQASTPAPALAGVPLLLLLGLRRRRR